MNFDRKSLSITTKMLEQSKVDLRRRIVDEKRGDLEKKIKGMFNMDSNTLDTVDDKVANLKKIIQRKEQEESPGQSPVVTHPINDESDLWRVDVWLILFDNVPDLIKTSSCTLIDHQYKKQKTVNFVRELKKSTNEVHKSPNILAGQAIGHMRVGRRVGLAVVKEGSTELSIHTYETFNQFIGWEGNEPVKQQA